MKFKFPDRKWVYIFILRLDIPILRYLPIPIAKAGFAFSSGDRADNIAADILEKFMVPVKLITVMKAKVFMYRKIEKAVHNVFGCFNVVVFRGASGWTEFFWTVNIVVGLLAYIALWYFDIDGAALWALIVMVLPLPLDLALSVALLAAVEYIIAGALIWVLWCLGIAGWAA